MRAAGLAVVAVLLGGAAWLASSSRPARLASRAASPAADAPVAAARPGVAPAIRGPAAPAEAAAGGRPGSLRGTRPDGALTLDAQGRFQPSPSTRWLFEYFLAASGEEAPDRIRDRIVATIERRLPPAPAAEAVALLDRYLAYRERARDLTAAGPMEERLDAIVRLRRDILGPADAEALFGEEEARDRAVLARRRALTDPSLSPEERARALEDASAALPEPVARAEAAATLPLRLGADEAALRAAGGSDADVQGLREATVGRAAAARLAVLDRERAAWDERVKAYRAARAAIEADAARTAEERERARAALLAERFTPTERLRVQALDTAPAP
jgi:lipase chaperone LimK